MIGNVQNFLHLGGLLQFDRFRQSFAEVGRDLREVGNGALLDEALSVDQMPGDVGNESFPCRLVQNGVPECRRLAEVVFVPAVVSVNLAGHLVGLLQVESALRRLGAFEGVGIVVRSASLVVVEGHRTVSLVILDADAVRAVDRQLQVVRAQAVTVSVGVGEQTSLQHLVRAGFDSRHQVSGREGGLLHFREVIVRIAVQRHLADGDQREFLLRPDFGDVERIEFHLLGFLERHDLQEEVP